MQNMDTQIAKVIKEKKMAEETNRNLSEQLQAEEDKVNHLSKIKQKMEANMDEVCWAVFSKIQQLAYISMLDYDYLHF